MLCFMLVLDLSQGLQNDPAMLPASKVVQTDQKCYFVERVTIYEIDTVEDKLHQNQSSTK